ncbi:alpha/beta hydrolase [Chitinimonas sp.]|uniref:alpha/beta hydrolase family protein n=1 Tax=Chitinimonas sp. TaxID=1934313 RepID=UPI002F95BEFF
MPSKAHSYYYGVADSQAGELYLPLAGKPAVVVLLHGGYWRMPWGRDQWLPVMEDLVARGYAVWNLGYRRVGEPGGGWPGTLDDVAQGVDYLAELVAQGVAIDLAQVVLVGHSAGAQLALWAAARMEARVRPLAVAAVAPALDLVALAAQGEGRKALAALLGGTPEEVPERYQAASPLARLPLGVPQLVIHGGHDEDLPLALTRNYVALAQAQGDPAKLRIIPEADHMDCLDPAGGMHAALCDWLMELCGSERA